MGSDSNTVRPKNNIREYRRLKSLLTLIANENSGGILKVAARSALKRKKITAFYGELSECKMNVRLFDGISKDHAIKLLVELHNYKLTRNKGDEVD